MNQRTSHFAHLLSGLCIALAVVALHARADEQSPLSEAEHRDIVAAIELDSAGKLLADAAFVSYLEQFDRFEQVEKRLIAWSHSHSPLSYDAWDPVLNGQIAHLRHRVSIRGWKERREAETAYLAFLAALTEDAGDTIAAVERRRLRERWLGIAPQNYFARSIGLGADLIAITRGRRTDWPAEVENAIDDYERGIDAALREVEDYVFSRVFAADATVYMLQEFARVEAERAGNQGVGRLIHKYASEKSRLISMLLRVRDFQKSHVKQLGSLMSSEDALRFRLRAEPTLHPYMAVTPDALLALREQLERDDLNEEQRGRIEALANTIFAKWRSLANRLGALHKARWNHYSDTQEEQLLSRVYRTPMAAASTDESEREEFRRMIEEWRELAASFASEIDSITRQGSK